MHNYKLCYINLVDDVIDWIFISRTVQICAKIEHNKGNRGKWGTHILRLFFQNSHSFEVNIHLLLFNSRAISEIQRINNKLRNK